MAFRITKAKVTKPVKRQRNLGSLKDVAKQKNVLETKNQAQCQGATKVPGKRIKFSAGKYPKAPPTKHFRCTFALNNKCSGKPVLSGQYPLTTNPN